MVKVQKVAVWKVEDKFYETAVEATKAIRSGVIRELLLEDSTKPNTYEDEADMLASLWDEIDRRVTKALSGV